MLHWLIQQLDPGGGLSFMNVGNYITVRAAMALTMAFLLSLIFGRSFIEKLREYKIGQHIRNSTGENAVNLADMHASKAGTPTMGGILMMGSLLVAVLLFGNLSEPVLWLAVAMAVGFGAIGFVDDYRKFTGQNSKGLSERGKIFGQVALGVAFAGIYMGIYSHVATYPELGVTGVDYLAFPFFKEVVLPLGFLYVPFAVLVLTATSNAVNLTDGLDGLAAGVSAAAAVCLVVVAYLAGRVDSAQYLFIPHIRGAGELAVCLAALTGSLFGFLWFNAHPAQVFMGDTGSMMIGGLLGAAALLLKQEFLLVIVGGVFVVEAASVILQVASYKLRGKRIFRMSPLHHHFEKSGIPESKIIVRFWLVSALLSLAALSTLKLR